MKSKKEILPIILIIASVVLIAANVITTEKYDRGFWMRNLSSILLIVAMIFTLISMRKQSDNDAK